MRDGEEDDRLDRDGGEASPAEEVHDAGSRQTVAGGTGLPPVLLDTLDLADPAALVLDETGRVVYANASTKALLDYDPGDSLEAHFTEICDHETSWLETQFLRFRQNGVWSGRVALLRNGGGGVNVSVNASVLDARTDNGPLFLAFIHPVRDGVVERSLPLEELPFSLGPKDLCLLHLLIEGFSVGELSAIVGESEDVLRAHLDEVCRKMHAGSPSDACVLALKQYLLS